MLNPNQPALIAAPMDGITDVSMRALLASWSTFTYGVSEFVRVNHEPIPTKVFPREVPEIITPTSMPVQVQILGGHPDRMAETAHNAISAGAWGIDINFGCPAPTVNRNDGGASLLKNPTRIRDIVRAVRDRLPGHIPVSAKLRLGWESIDDVHLNAHMAEEGGASWITLHARTRTQVYKPPVFWPKIGQVKKELDIPVIANGDIWSLDDYRRCQDQTGCIHFMIGRGSMAYPALPRLIAREMGIYDGPTAAPSWESIFRHLVANIQANYKSGLDPSLLRIKQWMKIAHLYGDFPHFHQLKLTQTLEEFFEALGRLERELAAV